MNVTTNYSAELTQVYHDDLAFLKSVVEQYPVSAFANFLYLYELKRLQDEGFEKQAEKTVLYFTNPLWMQYQLQLQNVVEVTIVDEGDDFDQENFPVKDPDEGAFRDHEAKDEMEQENEERQYLEAIEKNLIATKKELSDKEEQNLQNYPMVEQNENNSEADANGGLMPEDEAIAMGSKQENDIETAESPEPSLVKVSPEKNQSTGTETEQLPEKTAAQSIRPEDSVEEADAIEEREKEQRVEFVQGAGFSESEDIDEEPSFDPLHTVDYFASQGIIIREDAFTNDKLGNQVKSFTAWLKTMKTLHPGKIPEQNEVVEKIIQTAAEESNTQTDILTEAMAEVLLKQNKKDKAIEMYEKLSLMNPAKSTYFAAKIESIKHSNK